MQCFTLHARSYCTKVRFLDQSGTLKNALRFKAQNIGKKGSNLIKQAQDVMFNCFEVKLVYNTIVWWS